MEFACDGVVEGEVARGGAAESEGAVGVLGEIGAGWVDSGVADQREPAAVRIDIILQYIQYRGHIRANSPKLIRNSGNAWCFSGFQH